jgi:hypothetical protein
VVPQAATTRPDGPTGYLLARGVLDAPRRGAPYCKIARLIGRDPQQSGVNKGAESTLVWLLAIIGLSLRVRYGQVAAGVSAPVAAASAGAKAAGKVELAGAEIQLNRTISSHLEVMVIAPGRAERGPTRDVPTLFAGRRSSGHFRDAIQDFVSVNYASLSFSITYGFWRAREHLAPVGHALAPILGIPVSPRRPAQSVDRWAVVVTIWEAAAGGCSQLHQASPDCLLDRAPPPSPSRSSREMARLQSPTLAVFAW